jgi:hypothetical protein
MVPTEGALVLHGGRVVARRSTGVLVLVLIASAVGGCGAPDSASPDPAPRDRELPESALISGAYANPLDPIMFPDETEQGAITAAREALVSTCMQNLGFSYVAGDAFPQRRGAQDAQYTYSVTDPAVAAVYGFHPASWVEEVKADKSPSQSWAPGYEVALFGESDAASIKDDDGVIIATYDPLSCAGQAKDRVTPDWAKQERIVDVSADILLGVSDLVVKEPEFTRAAGAWSACMADKGYDYPTPMDANNDDAFATDLPTAQEIPVAVASAECQHDSGLLRTWSKVRAELTQQKLDEHPGLVAQWLEIQRDAARTATGA